MSSGPTRTERQQRLKTRALPLVGIALVSFIVGAIAGCPGNPNRNAAERYLEAWQAGDFPKMHSELSTVSREAMPLEEFTDRYEEAAGLATLQEIEPGEPGGDESEVEIPVTASTLAFDRIDQPMKFTFGDDGIAWKEALLFPGLEAGEQLDRAVKLPRRASILARDGQVMAEGPSLARSYPLGDSMIDVTGTVGTTTEELEPDQVAAGFSEGEPIGLSGVELAYNTRLAGKPGGTLSAVPAGDAEAEGRVLGEGEPDAAKPLKTTIDPILQETSVAALAGQSGGVAVIDAKRGNIRALAGQAYSLLQPPGSTMKIVTATAALDSGKATLDSEYEYATSGVADGREIGNAYGEVCGGSFVESFADSCNSVFAPLGMEIGEEQLTRTAEAFGFNRTPAIFNEEGTAAINPPVPTIPQPGEYNNELGVSAIGQGKVQATPLLMASVAQAIASGGSSMPTPIAMAKDLRPDAEPVRVTDPKTARQVTEAMVAVVTSGTGVAGAIPEAQVAGKTGTAEVGIRAGGAVDEEGNPDLIENAWFSAFAPAEDAKLAIGVMVLDASAGGGTVAAPIASQILSAGL
jgi:cell division protein FtsI/penicillin-binding protein 2